MPHPTREEVKRDIEALQAASRRQAGAPDPAPAPAQAGVQPAAAAPVAPANDTGYVSPIPLDTPTAASVQQAASATPAVAQPAATPPAADAEALNHRLATVQGILRAEQESHRKELEARDKTIELLQRTIETLQGAGAGATTPAAMPGDRPNAGPSPSKRFTAADITEADLAAAGVTAEDIEHLGADYWKLHVAVSRNSAAAGSVDSERVAKLERENRIHQFDAEIESMCPGFIATNKGDKGWGTWLDEADDITGMPRRFAVETAYGRNDSVAVANAMRKYLVHRSKQAQVDPKTALEAQAMPPSASAAPAPRPAGSKPIYTMSQVSQFYDDVQRGRFRGTEAEKAQIMAQIRAAQAEGRIRPG
jgi:hypothetical protein